ncbi:MAG: hypothetical protein NUV88_00765 [Candidatus Kaiserbacteria bacterium]|nr:hypothetical protein [Candidatus Kaiserbacteria bacterium]
MNYLYINEISPTFMRAKILGFSALSAVVLFAPVLASAQNIISVFATLTYILNSLMVLFITLAIVVFFWGLVKYIFNRQGGEKEGAAGASLMLWGIIALFVMVSIWGIIGVLRNTFGVNANTGSIPQPPGTTVVGSFLNQMWR